MHRHSVLLLNLIIFIAAPAFAQKEQTQNIDWDTFLKSVAAHHPEKNASDTDLLITRESENRAGLLSDPDLTIGRQNQPIGRRETDEMSKQSNSQTGWTIQATQMFPWPGALSQEKLAAAASSRAAELRRDLKEWERMIEAKELFVSLVTTSKFLQLEKETLIEADSVLKYAQRRLGLSLGTHHDVLQAQNESDILSANVAALEVELANLKDQAAWAMGRDDASQVIFTLEIPQYVFNGEKTQGEVVDLYRDRLDKSRAAREASLDAEYKKNLPAFMVSGMVMKDDDGMKSVSAMVGIKVPLFSGRGRSALSSEKALVEKKASNEIETHEKQKNLALRKLDRISKLAASNLTLIRERIRPSATEHFQQASLEFSQGRGSFVTVTDARRTLVKIRVAEARFSDELARLGFNREKIRVGLTHEVEVSASDLSFLSTQPMDGSMPSMSKMPMRKMRMPKQKSLPNASEPMSRFQDEGEPSNNKSNMEGM